MADGQFVSMDSHRSACLDRFRNAGSQGRVGTIAIVIGDEFAKCRTKMPLVHRDDEIQALAPDGPDQSLAESVGDLSSTAPKGDVAARRFRVTHPFHPLFGREFELEIHKNNWGRIGRSSIWKKAI